MSALPGAPPPPAAASSGATAHGGGDAVFDTKLLIFLAALFFALTCAVFINSIVRCLVWCGHHLGFETAEGAAARLAATGLKKKALRRIPVAVYGLDGNIPPAATECPICLGEFSERDKVRVLPKCNHVFHLRCIDAWFASHSTCPTCRRSLLDRAAAGGSTSPAVTDGDGVVLVVADEVSLG